MCSVLKVSEEEQASLVERIQRCQVIPAPLGQQWPAAAGRQKASNTGYNSSLCWNRGSPQNGTHGEILVPQAESCHQKQRALGFYRAPTSCEYQGPGGLFWLFC